MISYTPQQNGVAERQNRTLLDIVRSMMAHANLPISLWETALLTTTCILNCVPSKSISTPYELWTDRRPDLSYIRPWRAADYVHSNPHAYEKLDPRANKCIFIRYSDESKGYVMLGEQPDEIITEIESRDVFLEGEFPRKGDIADIDRFFEVDESHDGALNPDKEDESDLLSSKSVPSSESVLLRLILKLHFCVEANVETSLVIALRLREKLSCVFRKR